MTGTVNRPKVRLVSSPEVPESEKLAWLVLGRGRGEVGAGDAATAGVGVDTGGAVGVGVGGAALGFHIAPSASSQHVFGAQYASASDVFNGDGLILATYDYHLNGFSGRGWTLGAGVGSADYDGGRRDGESKTVAVFNVGYKF